MTDPFLFHKKYARTPIFMSQIDPSKRLKQTLGGLLLTLLLILEILKNGQKSDQKTVRTCFLSFWAPKMGVVTGKIWGSVWEGSCNKKSWWIFLLVGKTLLFFLLLSLKSLLSTKIWLSPLPLYIYIYIYLFIYTLKIISYSPLQIALNSISGQSLDHLLLMRH